MIYLAFDKALRDNINISKLPGIPLGYENFTTAFNNGTYLHDKQLLSTFISGTSGKPDYVNKSMNLVFLQDFLITPEQCGLPSPHRTNISDAHVLIMEDYATTQAYKNKR